MTTFPSLSHFKHSCKQRRCNCTSYVGFTGYMAECNHCGHNIFLHLKYYHLNKIDIKALIDHSKINITSLNEYAKENHIAELNNHLKKINIILNDDNDIKDERKNNIKGDINKDWNSIPINDDIVTVYICGDISQEIIQFNIKLSCLVKDFKILIGLQDNIGVDSIDLYFKKKRMDDNRSLYYHSIHAFDIIYVRESPRITKEFETKDINDWDNNDTKEWLCTVDDKYEIITKLFINMDTFGSDLLKVRHNDNELVLINKMLDDNKQISIELFKEFCGFITKEIDQRKPFDIIIYYGPNKYLIIKNIKPYFKIQYIIDEINNDNSIDGSINKLEYNNIILNPSNKFMHYNIDSRCTFKCYFDVQ